MRKPSDNRIEFTGYIRELLLKEICRYENVITIGNEELNLELKQVRGTGYLGTCPWCRQQAGFTMNSRSGACSCSHCGKSGDYLDLLCLSRGDSLAAALEFQCSLLKTYAKYEARGAREKRAAGKRLREPTGGVR